MGKKIDELKAAVEIAKQEKDAAEKRYDEALLAVLEAEREARRGKKPTPAMLLLLRELNNGATIRRQKYYPYRHVLVGASDARRAIPQSVLDGLFQREALIRTTDDLTKQEFTISEHGQTFIESSSPVDTQLLSV